MLTDLKPTWPIYKYRTIDIYCLDYLRREKLWAADPKTFNDPFECRVLESTVPRGVQFLREGGEIPDSVVDNDLDLEKQAIKLCNDVFLAFA